MKRRDAPPSADAPRLAGVPASRGPFHSCRNRRWTSKPFPSRPRSSRSCTSSPTRCTRTRRSFLRELISNASDACDKLRFEAIDKPELYEGKTELEVRVAFDKEAKTITITDNGIGLSAEEAVANLGTIAKSGTREFVSALQGDQKKDAQLIGQFGVGFYSGFIVADKITVESRRAGLPEHTKACAGPRKAPATSRSKRISSRRARYERHPAPARRRGGIPQRLEAALDHLEVFRPHLAADPDAEGGVGRGNEGAGDQGRMGAGQQGVGALVAAEERDHERAVRGVLQADQLRQRGAARVHAQPRRGSERIHAAALHPGQGAVRSLEPRQARRRQAVRQARLHHGRCRGADAGLPALRQGRHRLERPAAQCLARAAPGKPRRQGDPRRLDQARAVDARRPGRERGRGREGQVRRVLEGLRRRPQGRHRRRLRQSRAARRSSIASRRRTTTSGVQNVSLPEYVEPA